MASKLIKEAQDRGIKIPQKRTLARYGLTPEAWVLILKGQHWKCAVCNKEDALWNIDHQHIPGWKKMPPEERIVYVRGILCAYCNYRVVPSMLSASDAKRMAKYLAAYERRRSMMRR